MSKQQSNASSPLPTTAEEYRAWWREQRPTIPFGLCWCGCSQKTNIATGTVRKNLRFKDQPVRFCFGHAASVIHRKDVHYRVEDRGHDTPCWIWQLKIADNGYGHVTVGGRTKLAHRHFYEKHKGSIPVGLTLDHLCRVLSCINPDHLEAVTLTENQRRGSKTILYPELVAALKDARSKGVEFPTLEILSGIKRRTIIAAVYGENWSDC